MTDEVKVLIVPAPWRSEILFLHSFQECKKAYNPYHKRFEGTSGCEEAYVAVSIDRELRGLRRAGQRLEKAAKEWGEAHRLYVLALNELQRKTAPKNQLASGGPALPGDGR